MIWESRLTVSISITYPNLNNILFNILELYPCHTRSMLGLWFSRKYHKWITLANATHQRQDTFRQANPTLHFHNPTGTSYERSRFSLR